jgi:hypothetical protein
VRVDQKAKCVSVAATVTGSKPHFKKKGSSTSPSPTPKAAS